MRKDGKKCEAEGAFFIVEKSLEECQNETKIYAVLKKHNPIIYADADVDEKKRYVTTKIGTRVKLTSISEIQRVLRALQQQLHANNVTHGDLKPAHILEADDATEKDKKNIFFIDFGYSDESPHNLTRATGFTAKWTSFDTILSCKMHELDDYEAVFTSALYEQNVEGLPVEPQARSLKQWALWKLQLMDHVFQELFVPQHGPSKEVLEFIVQGLMKVWTLPRKTARLTKEQQEELVSHNNLDFQAHSAEVRKLFLSHLGHANASSQRVNTPLNDSTAEIDKVSVPVLMTKSTERYQLETVLEDVRKYNEKVIGCSNVCCWPTALKKEPPEYPNTVSDKKQSETQALVGPDNEQRWAEYDSLIFFDDEKDNKKGGKQKQKWQYQPDWTFLGQGSAYNVQLLQAISGQWLYLEATTDVKHIWHFVMKFEHFIHAHGWRPVDILLLVIGIQLECHGEPFFPLNFTIMLDVVQHTDWKCQVCHNHSLRNFDKFYYCQGCRLYVCWDCVQPSTNTTPQGGCATHTKHEFETKSKTYTYLLPSLSLFTLLLAGRFRVTNAATRAYVESQQHGSSAVIRAFEKKKSEYEAEKRELEKKHADEVQKLGSDNEKLVELAQQQREELEEFKLRWRMDNARIQNQEAQIQNQEVQIQNQEAQIQNQEVQIKNQEAQIQKLEKNQEAHIKLERKQEAQIQELERAQKELKEARAKDKKRAKEERARNQEVQRTMQEQIDRLAAQQRERTLSETKEESGWPQREHRARDRREQTEQRWALWLCRMFLK